MRTIQGDNITADLIFSKSRVAPTKPTSVPRLELFGVVLGAKMIKFLRKESPFEFDHTYLWTDSKCALAWVTQHESRPLFIKRRIKTIHEVENVQYGFVPGRENPADLVSRGANASELQQKEVWWKGPNWLEENPLPDTVVQPETVSQSAEECSTRDDCPTEPQLATSTTPGLLLDPEKYSRFSKLVRVNAWVCRFMAKIKRQPANHGRVLSLQEIVDSRTALVRDCQQQHFYNEIHALQKGKRNQLVNALGLFLDKWSSEVVREDLNTPNYRMIASTPCCYLLVLI